MYIEDNKCNGNCFCDCFILNRVRELTKDQPLHIKTYLDEKPYYRKVEAGDFEYPNKNLIKVEDTDEG